MVELAKLEQNKSIYHHLHELGFDIKGFNKLP